MGSDPIETLCTACGLCCDGTLLADVELAGRAEADRMEVLGLEVEEDGSRGGVMPLPCAALRGRRCSVYAHRPGTCRMFECQLLLDVRQGSVTLDFAQQQVVATHAQVAAVEAALAGLEPRGLRALPLRERCAEALSSDSVGEPVSVARRATLEVAQRALEASIQGTFLFRRR